MFFETLFCIGTVALSLKTTLFSYKNNEVFIVCEHYGNNNNNNFELVIGEMLCNNIIHMYKMLKSHILNVFKTAVISVLW